MRGLERDLGERIRIHWLNVDEPAGRGARAAFRNQKVPALILLDGAGTEAYRTEGKLPRVGRLRDELARLEGG